MNGWEVDGNNLPSLDQNILQTLTQNYPLCVHDKQHHRLFIIRKYSSQSLKAPIDDEPFVYGLACFFKDSSATYNLPSCEFTQISLENRPNLYYLPHLVFAIKGHTTIKTLPIDIAIAMDTLSQMDEAQKLTKFSALNNHTIYYTKKQITQKHVRSSIIGDLEQDKEFTDWWHSKDIQFPSLNHQSQRVTFWSFNPEIDDNFIQHADTALSNFLQLTHDQLITRYSNTMHQFCLTSVNASLQKKVRILNQQRIEFYQQFLEITEENIWEHLAFIEIGISRRSDGKIYLFLIANPEWDRDRNLEMIFEENGHLLTIRTR